VRGSGARIAAEFGGSAFLLAVIVGSGIMGQRLSAGNDAVALLGNSIATGAGLFALITALLRWDPHFNPAVTLLFLCRRQLDPRLASLCIGAQFAGAIAGVFCAHLMFSEPLVQASTANRGNWPHVFAEVVATAGLLAVVLLVPKRRVAGAVAAYIVAAYWFTSSTSFANPAVTVARALTGTFAGIEWTGVPHFLAGQVTGVLLVLLLGVGAAQAHGRRATPPDGLTGR
jgi:glycerol uptake facilitator-like aquaporin